MEEFQDYIDKIEDPDQKQKMTNVLQWVSDNFPQLDRRIAWNQPMFTHQGTFILGFSRAKKHMAISPEYVSLRKFEPELTAAGYSFSTMLFRIPWEAAVDYALLRRIIEFNIEDKAGMTTFWRKHQD